MAQIDPFFELKGEPSKIHQEEFYEHLMRSDHLRDTIYEPSELNKRGLRTTRLQGKIFERVSFSKTTIQNIIFRDCTFKNCLLIGSAIKSCEFHNCSFVQSNTYKISFEDTYINPKSFKNALDPRRHQNIGVHLYQTLMKNSRDSDQPEFESDAHFYFLRWKRFQDIYEYRASWKKNKDLEFGKRGRTIGRFLWEWFFGSGIRLRHFVGTVTLSIFLVALINFLFRQQLGLSGDPDGINSFIDSFYFSTITLTTLGFGDIVPATQLGRFFVATQGIFGFFLFAMLASMLFRKITS